MLREGAEGGLPRSLSFDSVVGEAGSAPLAGSSGAQTRFVRKGPVRRRLCQPPAGVRSGDGGAASSRTATVGPRVVGGLLTAQAAAFLFEEPQPQVKKNQLLI